MLVGISGLTVAQKEAVIPLSNFSYKEAANWEPF